MLAPMCLLQITRHKSGNKEWFKSNKEHLRLKKNGTSLKPPLLPASFDRQGPTESQAVLKRKLQQPRVARVAKCETR